MKKLFAFCLVLMLCLPIIAHAEVDLKSMTFEELIELGERISAELTTRPEWKEVTVPPGVYEIGVDIPAGHWTITPKDDYVVYVYGNKLNETKTGIDDITESEGAAKAGTMMSSLFHVESVSIEVKDGYWICLDNYSFFTPYIRPTLGF